MLYYPEAVEGNGTICPGLYYESLEECENRVKEINKAHRKYSSGDENGEYRENTALFLKDYRVSTIKKHFTIGLDSEQVRKIIDHRMYEYSRGVYTGEFLTDKLFEEDGE